MAGHGRAFVVAWQEEDTKEALRAAYRAERDVVVRQRLHALWLLRSGDRRMDEVAGLVGANYRTVQRWVAWYRDGGLDAIRAHRMGGYGQTPRLTAEQQEQLAAEVATGRFRNAVAIRAWVSETFGVTYTEGGMYSLLERLRCKPTVPRPLHEQANLADQEAWKKGDSQQRSRTPASA
jgi:transposase